MTQICGEKEALDGATTSGSLTFETGAIVEDRHTLHSLVLHLRGDVNTGSTAGTTVTAKVIWRLRGRTTFGLPARSTSGNVYLRAVNDILTNDGVTVIVESLATAGRWQHRGR